MHLPFHFGTTPLIFNLWNSNIFDLDILMRCVILALNLPLKQVRFL